MDRITIHGVLHVLHRSAHCLSVISECVVGWGQSIGDGHFGVPCHWGCRAVTLMSSSAVCCSITLAFGWFGAARGHGGHRLVTLLCPCTGGCCKGQPCLWVNP